MTWHNINDLWEAIWGAHIIQTVILWLAHLYVHIRTQTHFIKLRFLGRFNSAWVSTSWCFISHYYSLPCEFGHTHTNTRTLPETPNYVLDSMLAGRWTSKWTHTHTNNNKGGEKRGQNSPIFHSLMLNWSNLCSLCSSCYVCIISQSDLLVSKVSVWWPQCSVRVFLLQLINSACFCSSDTRLQWSLQSFHHFLSHYVLHALLRLIRTSIVVL